MRIDIRDSKYSIIYNENTGAVEDVLWCNESAEDLKNLNIVADMARELAVYRRAGVAMVGAPTISALSTVCVSTTIIYALQKLWIC